jgi:hypothetical protein
MVANAYWGGGLRRRALNATISNPTPQMAINP